MLLCHYKYFVRTLLLFCNTVTVYLYFRMFYIKTARQGGEYISLSSRLCFSILVVILEG